MKLFKQLHVDCWNVHGGSYLKGFACCGRSDGIDEGLCALCVLNRLYIVFNILTFLLIGASRHIVTTVDLLTCLELS